MLDCVINVHINIALVPFFFSSAVCKELFFVFSDFSIFFCRVFIHQCLDFYIDIRNCIFDIFCSNFNLNFRNFYGGRSSIVCNFVRTNGQNFCYCSKKRNLCHFHGKALAGVQTDCKAKKQGCGCCGSPSGKFYHVIFLLW